MIYFNCTTTSPAHSTYTAHSLQCKPSASLNDIITSATFDDLAIERQCLRLQAVGRLGDRGPGRPRWRRHCSRSIAAAPREPSAHQSLPEATEAATRERRLGGLGSGLGSGLGLGLGFRLGLGLGLGFGLGLGSGLANPGPNPNQVLYNMYAAADGKNASTG